MSTEEVSAIFSLMDVNKDGKLDYADVSFHSVSFKNVLFNFSGPLFKLMDSHTP